METETEHDRRPLQLSPRELQLIKFASEGLTDTAIAHRLGISEATVSTYWGRVRIKIGPFNRTELVSVYLRSQQEVALEVVRRENAKVIEQLRATASEQAALHQALIENAPDAIVIVSDAGVVTSANKMAHELFGYEEGGMSDLPLINLIPERLREVHQRHRQEYVDDPRRRTMGEHLATPAMRKDGSEMLVRAALSAIATSSGMLITCVLRSAESES